MALRAGYYGIKRFLRDKLEMIAGTYDETIKSLFPRSEQAVLGAKNITGTKYVSGTDHSVVWRANSDGSITAVSGTATGDNAQNGLANPFTAPFTSPVSLTGGVDSHIYLFPYDVTDSSRPYTDSSKTTRVSGSQYGDTPLSFYMEKGHKYSIIARVVQNYSADNNTLYPLITVASDTDYTYEPYAMTNKELTDSAADQKTAINAIITAATGAADFAAFKTAMGAITPVTRSLSLTKEDITEEVKEAEPEKTVTKKRTTKKTEEV